jgi:hypothetical protein
MRPKFCCFELTVLASLTAVFFDVFISKTKKISLGSQHHHNFGGNFAHYEEHVLSVLNQIYY